MSENEAKDPNMREGAWAEPVSKLEVEYVSEGVTAINIQGRQAIGALLGFRQLWKKTYTSSVFVLSAAQHARSLFGYTY